MISQNTFLNGKVAIRQPQTGFRSGIDAVFLAAFADRNSCKNAKILDMGCGVGAVSLCLGERLADLDVHITGVEINAEYQKIGLENITLNKREGQIDFIQGDFRQMDLRGFTHVFMNPPYMESDKARLAHDDGKKAANAEIHGGLEEWIKHAHLALKHKAYIHIVHRADALPRILNHMQNRFGAIEVFPLFSKAGEAANRVLVRGRKDLKTPFKILPGLVVHQENTDYTVAAESVLRDGEGIK